MKPEKHDCSRRDFLKHSLLGAVALGVASFPGEPLTGAIRNIEGRRKKTARRVVLLSLDGICVEGFRKARTPHLDNLLAQGVLSLKTRVVMPSANAVIAAVLKGMQAGAAALIVDLVIDMTNMIIKERSPFLTLMIPASSAAGFIFHINVAVILGICCILCVFRLLAKEHLTSRRAAGKADL